MVGGPMCNYSDVLLLGLDLCNQGQGHGETLNMLNAHISESIHARKIELN